MVVGICVGETSLSEVTFISDKMPKVGEYVTIEYDGKKVLGMIENLIRGNDALNVDINDFKAIRKISQIGADIKLGCLVNQSDVDVNVEANPILSRHLAILAMTGAGKSNTVSVLINEMLSYFVPVFVFDMHGEYVGANFPNGEVNVIKPKINPVYMSFHEIKRLVNIPSNGYIQERHFRRAFKTAKEMVRSGTAHTNNFLQIIYDILLSDSQEEGSDKQIVDVMNKIDDSMDKYANIFDNNIGNILTNIKIGHVNVLDLSQSDESIANVLVSHIMRNALQMRKNAVHGKDERALDFPVFFILEEAHILAPNKRDSDSKRWIQRVAREGRKFGLGLCEPEDQRHVQSASESLSQDLVNQLPSLNVGEAVVLGLMSKVPTLVKIDEFKGRLHGDDMDIVSYFADIRQKEQEEIEELEKESMEMGYNY